MDDKPPDPPRGLVLVPAEPLGVGLAGQLIGLLSFDVGYEIDLERARGLLDAGQVGEIGRRRAAPPYLGYTTPPLRAPLGTHPVHVGDVRVDATAVASIHDFGAVTIIFHVPLTCDVAALPALTAMLTGAGPLEDAGRRLLELLCERVRPAITKPGPTGFVEDYYVIQIDRLTPPLGVGELLVRARGVLASALRCEASPLSETEIEDALRTALAYYPDDLVLTDWNVAVVVDTEWADALNVFEYLNVQLLELRYFDALLDRRVADMYGRTTALLRPQLRHYRAHRRTIGELAAIRLDVSTIIERVENALKLSPDLYLAKLYARTAERLGLRSWETSVAGKLQVLESLWNVLLERVATTRAELLEMTIIALIAVEIVILLAGWG